jgi:hypothetical protein
MWVELSVGGAADLAKRNPEPPTGGEAYTDLLCERSFLPSREAACIHFLLQFIHKKPTTKRCAMDGATFSI